MIQRNSSRHMSANEFSRSLEELGLDWKSAPDALGVSKRTVFHYSSGTTPITGPVARLVRLWLEIAEKKPKNIRLPFDVTEV